MFKDKFRQICFRLSIPTPRRKADRRFLEGRIFPWLNDKADIVLLAGVEIYTWHYPKLLNNVETHTIDFNPSLAKYGNGQFHIVGSVCQLHDYYEAEQFDVIIYNGLIGFGLNKKEDANEAIEQAFIALKPSGMLIIGWNNIERFIHYRLEDLPAYQKFTPYIPKELGLDSHRYITNTKKKHSFDFLIKP